MRLKSSTLLALTLFLFIRTPQAGLNFALTPQSQSGVGGNIISFSGALTNTSLTTNLFLNGIQFILTGNATNYLTLNTNAFYANVPGILSSNGTYADVVFAIELNPSTPLGNYAGNITIQGGTNIFATNNLSTQPFQISLMPANLTIAGTRTNLLISWPSPPTGSVLQRNPNLFTTNWTTVTNVPVLSNALNQLILSLPSSNQFYRLKYP